MIQQRCTWATSNPMMRDYHDRKWGVPERDPRMLWETLMLEGFQAGLSWEKARGEDFADYCWSFTDGKPILGDAFNTETDLSSAISKDLKKRGFKFVGPTIVYAWMQAVGIVNDHTSDCFRRKPVIDMA